MSERILLQNRAGILKPSFGLKPEVVAQGPGRAAGQLVL